MSSAGSKSCSGCGEEKPTGDFYRNDLAKGNLHSRCKACCIKASNERQKRLKNDPEWRRAQTARLRRWREKNPERAKAQRERGVQRNREHIARVKAAGCLDCGGVFPTPAMEFDHVRGEKVATVSQMVAGAASLERLKAEIAKCDVVCANCHRLRHHSP